MLVGALIFHRQGPLTTSQELTHEADGKYRLTGTAINLSVARQRHCFFVRDTVGDLSPQLCTEKELRARTGQIATFAITKANSYYTVTDIDVINSNNGTSVTATGRVRDNGPVREVEVLLDAKRRWYPVAGGMKAPKPNQRLILDLGYIQN